MFCTIQVEELDLPLKCNQLVVAKFISLIREDGCYWCKELLAAENNEGRQKILKLEVIRIVIAAVEIPNVCLFVCLLVCREKS